MKKYLWKYRLAVLICFCGVLTSCTVSKHRKGKSASEEYRLLFEDQFNGDAYSQKYWTSYPEKQGKAPWNRFVINDPKLAEVKNGNLHIRARWNSETEHPETGAIQTKDKFSFKYGKIEVRAKFNRAEQGGWPAIWLMPQNEIYPGWPNGGEIDIMERLNTDSFVHQVVHQTNGEAKHNSIGITQAISPTDYNTYGIIKTPNRIEFYVNDQLTMVHEPKDDFAPRWPFETDYYLILNHASADKGKSGVDFWPGPVTSTENFPLEMAIDYVKVWELKD
ncbi:glycoside hydrolase family 16 protein [Gelidibacter mesophilus]|uniref:glycoside hydrolase family 16 protein n=1 Tax=Gelidibacter mesophilus TaxID=169050 RepID=UPI00048864DD|nr:glycoside hydrolase family 16 protein [Gelidibacter mesophilus]